MNVLQLQRTLNELIRIAPEYQNLEEVEVLIRTSDPSIGPSSAVPVRGVGFGFDWDHGRFLISPETPVVRRKGSVEKEIQKARDAYGKKYLEQERRIRELEKQIKELKA